MRRRDFLGVLGLVPTCPLQTFAQQVTVPTIGFLGSGSRDSIPSSVAGFIDGLKNAGFTDKSNVFVEFRWAEGRFDRLPTLAAELVRRPVAVLLAAQGNVSALAAKRATTTIPIVFVTSDDPVSTGLVTSLNRPGGNLTGVARLGTALAAKNVELIRELIPTIPVVGLLVNPKRPTVDAQLSVAQNTAKSLGVSIRVLNASNEQEIEGAFQTIASEKITGLVVAFDGVFSTHRKKIIGLAAQLGVPSTYSFREFVAEGGLMCYGDDPGEAYRVAGDLVARILKGRKPADLPVEQATKVNLTLNLKTAKTLGLNIPLSLLGRADEVIE